MSDMSPLTMLATDVLERTRPSTYPEPFSDRWASATIGSWVTSPAHGGTAWLKRALAEEAA